MSICKECGGTYYPTTADTQGKCYMCRNKITIRSTGDISAYKEPEPTHSDILAAIQALREDIRRIR